MLVRLLAICALLCGVSACGFGDNSAQVRFHNATDVSVNVYETDGRQKGPPKLVPVGETISNQWVIPAEYSGRLQGSPRQVEAATVAGEVLFCHRFTYEELQRANWTIEITRRNDCGSTG